MMVTSQAAQANASPELITERYRVEKLLGRGGMAAVYQVFDTAKQRVVALKRLLHSDQLDGHVAKLFEREYHTLSQLVHPRIIEVYDYHTDAQGPFYTMELLTGGDLRQRSPISWRDACRLLCDVCSALALLHSRRFVHRDLTPLNIRCTVDERAKLFDFGSMAQFGRSKHVVGTPPFVAPEALHGQVLDGHTDLYALGATAYYALTGRHAYPARALSELPDLWRSAPAPPSTIVAGIPAALDELIMSLLTQHPSARPPSAAEVMERLSAIGGFEIQEALLVGEAYLSTPTLVGRDEHLASFARQLRRANEAKGTSILVNGASGTGRSRLLDACALDAKLSGAIVLRADASDSGGQRWGAARALISQLLEQLPELGANLVSSRVAILGPLMPELVERFRPEGPPPEARQSETGGSARAELQAALREIVLEVAKQRTLVLILDDFDRIDEPSAALAALLAHQARQHRLLLLSSVDSEVKAREFKPLRLMASVSDVMRLRNLDAEQTQQLVISLFGDVPNVRFLADRIFGVTRGGPRLVMQVAQHLVDRGVCRYAAGTWTLPASLASDALTGALRETIDPDLSPSALELARALAASELPRVTIDECMKLSGQVDTKRAAADLYQLAAAGIVTVDDASAGLSRPSWERLLLEDLTPEQQRPFHLRVADMLESRPGEEFRRAQHLLQAGEVERALALLVKELEEKFEARTGDPVMVFEYVLTLPPKWPETLRGLIEATRRLKRPVREWIILVYALLGYSVLTARSERKYTLELAERLRHDAGLDLIAEYQGKVPDSELLMKALGDAQKRYDATPEHERGLPILEALKRLGELITQTIGMAGRTFDVELLDAMPSLTPLMALSPALQVVQRNVECSRDIMSGRTDRAREGYAKVVKRLEEPDGAGLSTVHRVQMRLACLYASGLIEANAGRPRALERAAAVEHDRLFSVSAPRLRAIYALSQGDRAAAEQYRAQTELLQIQNSPPQLLEGAQAMQWTFGYAAIGDLLRVKQTLIDVELLAREHPGWKPVLHAGRGAYQGLRGDYKQAEQEFEQALALVAIGQGAAWPFCASGLLWTLVRQERYADAIARGRQFLADMEAREMYGTMYNLQVSLAFAESAVGDTESALAHIQAAIEFLSAEGGAGVALGQAYEVRGYIAIAMNDAPALREFAQRCQEQYSIGKQPALLARAEKLRRAGRKAGLLSGPRSVEVEAQVAAVEDVQTTVSTVLSTAQGPEERAERALQLLGRFTRCQGGFLYIMQRQGPVLVAQLGSVTPPLDIDSFVHKFLLDALEQRDVTQTAMSTSPDVKSFWTVTEGTRFTPLLLSHAGNEGMSITGVAVMTVPAKGGIRVPTRLIQALSKALYDAGDAITQLTRELEGELPE